MFEQDQESNAVLIDTVISKLDQHDAKIQAQDEKIEAVQKRIDQTRDPNLDIKALKNDVKGLQRSSQIQGFAEGKIEELSSLLRQAIPSLRQPVTSSVEHHHHIHKIIWIAVGLFLLVCVTAMGWRETSINLGDFAANDIKYRKLKLTVDSASQVYLWRLDSLYMADPDALRKNVNEQERMNQERFELLKKAGELKLEIDSLAKKSGALKVN